MSRRWAGRPLLSGAALSIVMTRIALTAGQTPEAVLLPLDDHPAIQYARQPTHDPVAKLARALAQRARSLERDPRTGYLRPVLDALDVPVESQLLVFSKTGVQRAYTSPQHPRAVYFNESAAVAYVPDAPIIELAAHDPQQGVVFYTLDQTATAPRFTRQTRCLSCHVSATTLNVPGAIVRSHAVAGDGRVLPQFASNDVNHTTPHPDRWGGWFVTSEGSAAPYAQRAHSGNITFTARGDTSNQVFVDWLNSAPESRGYPSTSSDIAALLTFDHQARAINLMTRLNWEARVAASDGSALSSGNVDRLARDLAEYLLFVGEAALPVPLTPRAGFAQHLQATAPKDRRGRSFGQLDLVDHLLRYRCSYMVYSAAFDALPPVAKAAVYRRMLEVLTADESADRSSQFLLADRRAVWEILRDTKPDFPGG